MGLSKEQIARYSRQLILPDIGVRGQQRLQQASVLVIGAGGLGSPAALYLAAAGVGRLGVIDDETVELGNLHRQVLHDTRTVGQPKTVSAHARLSTLNPDVRVEAMQEHLSAVNALSLVGTYDLVLDGSDNVPTRYLVNDACVFLGKPLIYGGVIEWRGQLMAIKPRVSACVRCVFPEPPPQSVVPRCQEAGVVGTLAGAVGSLMAHEALKMLVGAGEPLFNRLFVIDGLTTKARQIRVRRDPDCAVCGEAPSIKELTELAMACD